MLLRSGREQALWSGMGAVLAALWFVLLNGWRPLEIILLSAAVHEGGHWLALRLLHTPVTFFRITMFGMEMRTQNNRLSYPEEIAAVLAGPAANLLCGALLGCLHGTYRIPGEIAGANFVLGGFNLLPVRPLDGGHILELLVAWTVSPDCGERAAGQAEILFGLSCTILLLWIVFRTRGNLWLLPPATFLACPATRMLFGKRKNKNLLASCKIL
jgi:Zn-dependent protease